MPRGGRKGGHSGSEAEEYRQWIAGKGPGLIPVPNVNGLRLVPEAICAFIIEESRVLDCCYRAP